MSYFILYILTKQLYIYYIGYSSLIIYSSCDKTFNIYIDEIQRRKESRIRVPIETIYYIVIQVFSC